MTGGVWVWVGLTWTDRVRLVLDQYGDRLTDVSIFGWRVNGAGALTQIFNPALLDPYRAKWPHIRWWLCVMNDGIESVFDAVRDNPTSRAAFVGNVGNLADAHPWATGMDIDLERGGPLTNATAAEHLFQMLADEVHTRGRLLAAALPGMDSDNGSVGGENWARYRQLGQILDRLNIMSYGMGWAGSAPGPVSPRDWLEGIYNHATAVVDPAKISMGLPAYGFAWRIHDYPPFPTITSGYRASTATYYGARLWLDGTWVHDPAPQPHIPWLAFRDDYEHAPYALPHVYDWCEATDYNPGSARGISSGTFNHRPYTTRFGPASGDPLWSVADATDRAAGATYALAPRQFRDRDGNWATPAGLTLTLECLKRPPESAIIWDDDFRTAGQVGTSYYRRSGSWSQWPASNPDRRYSQARVGTAGGTLDLNHDFGRKALHVQARLQLPAAGRAGVHIGTIRAEVSNTGVLRLTNGSTVLASTSVSAPGVSTTPGTGTVVVGLRIRGTKARAYFGTSETSVPLRLTATVPAAAKDGSAGVWANRGAWFDHLRVGDGWWYQPREAFTVRLGDQTWTVGRIPRSGVTWNLNKNVFRPTADVEEIETRTRDISLDWDFDHLAGFPIDLGQTRQVTIRPLDVGCWLGRIFLCDSDGASVLWYADAAHTAWWADRARFEWGLAGFALWSLGQEDVRLWDHLAGGELPQSAAV